MTTACKRAVHTALALLLAFALAACFTVPVYAASLEASSEYYVNDAAGVLSQTTKDTIVNKNITLEQASGAQLVVVTIERTNGLSLERFAYEIGNAWGVGSAEKNNGVLLVLDISGEDYMCIQGTGLESLLPTSRVSMILQEYLEPDFAAGDYDAGTLKTFNALYDELAAIYKISGSAAATAPGYTGTYDESYDDYDNDYGYVQSARGAGIGTIVGLIAFLVMVLVLISVLSSLFRPRRYGASNSVVPFLMGMNYRPYRRRWYGSHMHQPKPPTYNPNLFNGGFSGGGLFGSGRGSSSGFGGGGGGFSGGRFRDRKSVV